MLPIITVAILGFGCTSGIDITATSNSPSANSTYSLITMQSPESELSNQEIKQLVERQANAWETADSHKLIADFAEDSLFVVPGSTFRGRQAIKEAADLYFAESTDTKVTIKRIVANGNEGAIEWSWTDRNRKTGEISKAEDAIIFELENGKIKYWREYIDTQPQGN